MEATVALLDASSLHRVVIILVYPYVCVRGPVAQPLHLFSDLKIRQSGAGHCYKHDCAAVNVTPRCYTQT